MGWGGTYNGDFAAVKMLRSDIPIKAGAVCGDYADYSRNFQICAGDCNFELSYLFIFSLT